MVKFLDIELAFQFVSGAEYGMNSATLSKKTGQIYFESGLGDSDELPEDIDDEDLYIQIPHKRDLDLGIQLVREYVSAHLPEKADEVEAFFRSRGAYSRYKELLSWSNALDKWYKFEEERTETALKKWCVQNTIQIEEGDTGNRTIGSNGENAVYDG
jgi:hypothetical protein